MLRRIALPIFGVLVLGGWSFSRRQPQPTYQEPWKVVEEKGIEGVGFLGDNISQVQKIWGKAERVVRDDWPYSPYWYHEYHRRGVVFETDRAGSILGITLYCKTDRETVYAAFNGYTAKGLAFRSLLRPEEVYAVYGKPRKRVAIKEGALRANIEQAEPFIFEAASEVSIIYPMLEWMCAVRNDLVETCHVGGLHGPLK